MSDCKARLHELGTVIQWALLILFAMHIVAKWTWAITDRRKKRERKEKEVICSRFGTHIWGIFFLSVRPDYQFSSPLCPSWGFFLNKPIAHIPVQYTPTYIISHAIDLYNIVISHRIHTSAYHISHAIYTNACLSHHLQYTLVHIMSHTLHTLCNTSVYHPLQYTPVYMYNSPCNTH